MRWMLVCNLTVALLLGPALSVNSAENARPDPGGETSPLERLSPILPPADAAQLLHAHAQASALALQARYAPLAEAGDAIAQYELSLVYAGCIRSPTAANMEFYKHSAAHDADDLARYRNEFLRCAGLREQLDEDQQHDQLHQLAVKWRDAAAESGNLIAANDAALLRYMREWDEYTYHRQGADGRSATKPKAPSPEIIYSILDTANASDNARYRHLAFRAALFYFVWVGEKDGALEAYNFDRERGHLRRPPLSEAWRLLSCAWSTFCSLPEWIARIEQNYYPYEVDEIVAVTLDLYDAVQRVDKERLGFQ